MRIRLTRKFAEQIDGIDLSRRRVGDVIDLPTREGRILIAEGWARVDDQPSDRRAVHPKPIPAAAASDQGRPRSRRR